MEESNYLKEVKVRLCLKEETGLYSPRAIENPKVATDIMKDLLQGLDREMVCVVNIDNKMRPVNYNVVSIGDINLSITPVQNIFKSSILSNAFRVMLFHNHPSGDITPSTQDISLTRRIISAGKFLDIPLADHIIIGGVNGKTYSFRENMPRLFNEKAKLSLFNLNENEVAEEISEYGGDKSMQNMRFEEFVNEVKSNIKNYLPEKYENAEVKLNQIDKLGESYTGLTVSPKGASSAPSINLNQFYEESSGNISEVLKEITGIITGNELNEDMSWLMDYEKVKDNLFIRVSNAERNDDVLKNAPHTRIEDLAITYHIKVDVPGKGLASMLITNHALNMYGISKEQLHHDAIKNSMSIFPASINTMNNMLFVETGRTNDVSSLAQSGNKMMVLSNREQINGAASLFYPSVKDEIANIMKENYFILPSSVNEVILMPEMMGRNVEKLEQIVKNVNKTNVSPNEFLSNHVYHYDAKERLFERGDRYEARIAHAHEKSSVIQRLQDNKGKASEINALSSTATHKSPEQSI